MDWLDRLLGLPQNAIENVGLSWVFLLILLVIAVIAIGCAAGVFVPSTESWSGVTVF